MAFGSGYAGLGLLSDFQPALVKLDMHLVRDIDRDRATKAIVGRLIATCNALDIDLIAEGVETLDEARTLREMGIQMYQGFYVARPACEALPAVSHEVLADLT